MNAPEHHDLTVEPGEGGMRLDAWLGRRAPGGLSRVRLHGLIGDGQVWVDGEPATVRQRTVEGQRVTVVIPPAVKAEPCGEEMELDVVYDDADVAVINKPPGLVVHPAVGHARGTLVNGLLHRFNDLGGINGVERPGIVHRLDKDTSGLLVIAKNDAAMNALKKSFQDGAVEKIYWALTHGAPSLPAATLRTRFNRHPRDRKRFAVVGQGGREAVTHYRVAAQSNGVAWFVLRLETGRTHQIRVHLHHLGCPVVGDPAYGRRACDKELPGSPARQMLHAFRLGFPHPRTGRHLAFERPPPADMRHLMQHLGFDMQTDATPPG